MKIIKIDNADEKVLTGNIGYIGRYIAGKLTDDQINGDSQIHVTIADSCTGNMYKCKLINVIPIKHVIPLLFSRLHSNQQPEQVERYLLREYKLQELGNNFAFYLYSYEG